MPGSIEINDNYSEKIHYDFPAYPIYAQRGLLSHYPNFRAPNHWHDDIELIALLSGKMDYNVNGEIIPLHAGEGILVNAGQMHFGFSDSQEECDFICILLSPELLCPLPSYEQDFIRPFTQNTQIPYVLLQPEIDWHREIYNRIVSVYQNKSAKSGPLKVLGDFAEIWSLVYDNLPPAPSQNPTENRDLKIVKHMADYIQKNYTQKISLKDIASAGAVGQSKCCKLFALYFSQTPVTYLTQYRISKSIELLRCTDMSIIEIALSTGFCSPSYYAETFRKWMGQTPSQYRGEYHFHNPVHTHFKS